MRHVKDAGLPCAPVRALVQYAAPPETFDQGHPSIWHNLPRPMCGLCANAHTAPDRMICCSLRAPTHSASWRQRAIINVTISGLQGPQISAVERYLIGVGFNAQNIDYGSCRVYRTHAQRNKAGAGRPIGRTKKRVSGYGRNECRPDIGASLKQRTTCRIDLRFECTRLIRHVD